ncbi:RES domain-containing protein [Rubrivivax gelatinosus]|uniref:RES domain-containing protein n=1 Tax=Rubrivivax gelatinosus TaxID=28068 RepID=UPI003D319721
MSRGQLKLAVAVAVAGTGHGRFDLAAHPVAHLAESPETAADETLARRETVSLSISMRLKHRLLTLHTTRSSHLGGASSRPLSPCRMSSDPTNYSAFCKLSAVAASSEQRAAESA